MFEWYNTKQIKTIIGLSVGVWNKFDRIKRMIPSLDKKNDCANNIVWMAKIRSEFKK